MVDVGKKTTMEKHDVPIVGGVLTLNITPELNMFRPEQGIPTIMFRFTHDTDITSIVVNVDSTLLDAAFTVLLQRIEGASSQTEVPLPSSARYRLDDATIKCGAVQDVSLFEYLGVDQFLYCGTFRS